MLVRKVIVVMMGIMGIVPIITNSVRVRRTVIRVADDMMMVMMMIMIANIITLATIIVTITIIPIWPLIRSSSFHKNSVTPVRIVIIVAIVIIVIVVILC